MDDNWIVENLENALATWNEKLAEIWQLVSMTPQEFKGGGIWNIVVQINDALQAIGYGLLVLFFAMGLFKNTVNFQELRRPEAALRYFLHFVAAKAAVTYCMPLMLAVFDICGGIVSTVAGQMGGMAGNVGTLPGEISAAIGNVGFLASIPLWLVTILGSLFITVLSFILNTDDDVLICDPEAEFGPVVDAVRGQNIRLAPDSTQHVNALELGKGYEAGEKPVSLKSEFILTLYEHLLDVQTNGRRAKSIIDRAVLDLYEEFSKKPQAPTLQDLYRILQCQKENLAKDIVLASEIFTKGSLNTFAQPTNVQLDNRVLCFNIRDLGQQLRPIGMLVLMEVVMMRVMQNRLRGKRTWIYFDELSVLFSYEWSTNFLDVSWKRYRKYGALASGIFQNLDQALDNEVARSMISNSEFLVLLNQAASDRTKLAELLHISDTQLSYVTDSEAGRGLLKMGGSLVPFINDIPKDTQLYKLMSTRPGEV